MPTAAPSVLHVTNGDSVSGTLRDTSLGGEPLSWREALHEGPVPRLPEAELRAARAAFLAACGWGSADVIAGELERRDTALSEALADGRPVVLWFEHDLFDQLLLLEILAAIAASGHDPGRIELIQVSSVPGRERFHGLGELGAAELERVWPARRAVEPELVETGSRLWDAFRAPTPEAIEAASRRDAPGLPHLAAAFRRLLEELPDSRTGLSRSERQVLETLDRRASATALELFVAAQDLEEAPYEGDGWAFRRIALLTAGRAPLVRVEQAGTTPAGTSFGLTDAGREVLAGRADAVALRGIDRWLGGTHLRDGAVWRWDANATRLVAPG